MAQRILAADAARPPVVGVVGKPRRSVRERAASTDIWGTNSVAAPRSTSASDSAAASAARGTGKGRQPGHETFAGHDHDDERAAGPRGPGPTVVRAPPTHAHEAPGWGAPVARSGTVAEATGEYDRTSRNGEEGHRAGESMVGGHAGVRHDMGRQVDEHPNELLASARSPQRSARPRTRPADAERSGEALSEATTSSRATQRAAQSDERDVHEPTGGAAEAPHVALEHVPRSWASKGVDHLIVKGFWQMFPPAAPPHSQRSDQRNAGDVAAEGFVEVAAVAETTDAVSDGEKTAAAVMNGTSSSADRTTSSEDHVTDALDAMPSAMEDGAAVRLRLAALEESNLQTSQLLHSLSRLVRAAATTPRGASPTVPSSAVGAAFVGGGVRGTAVASTARSAPTAPRNGSVAATDSQLSPEPATPTVCDPVQVSAARTLRLDDTSLLSPGSSKGDSNSGGGAATRQTSPTIDAPLLAPDRSARNGFLKSTWMPLCKELLDALTVAKGPGRDEGPTSQSLPPQLRIDSWTKRCERLSAAWLLGDLQQSVAGAAGVPRDKELGSPFVAEGRVALLYAWLSELSQFSGSVRYRWELVPTWRSLDGVARAADCTVRDSAAVATQQLQRTMSPTLPRSADEQRASTPSLTPAVSVGDVAGLSPTSQEAAVRAVLLRHVRRKQATMLQVVSSALGLPLLTMGAKDVAAELATFDTSEVGIDADTFTFRLLRRHGCLLETWSALTSDEKAQLNGALRLHVPSRTPEPSPPGFTDAPLSLVGNGTFARVTAQRAPVGRDSGGTAAAGAKGAAREGAPAAGASPPTSPWRAASGDTARYLALNWQRTVDLVAVSEAGDEVQLCRTGDAETSFVVPAATPRSEAHGEARAASSHPEGLALDIERMLFEGWALNPASPRWAPPRARAWSPRRQQLASAGRRPSGPRRPRLLADVRDALRGSGDPRLPGEEYHAVGQDASCCAPLRLDARQPQRTHVWRATAAVVPLARASRNPTWVKDLRAHLDVVQVGAEVDSFVVVVRTRRPRSMLVARFLQDVCLHVRRAVGGACDFAAACVPIGDAAGTFSVMLWPLARVVQHSAGDALSTALQNSMSLADTTAARVPAVPPTCFALLGSFEVSTPRELSLVLEGGAVVRRYHDFVRCIGARRIVRRLLLARFNYVDLGGACDLPQSDEAGTLAVPHALHMYAPDSVLRPVASSLEAAGGEVLRDVAVAARTRVVNGASKRGRGRARRHRKVSVPLRRAPAGNAPGSEVRARGRCPVCRLGDPDTDERGTNGGSDDEAASAVHAACAAPTSANRKNLPTHAFGSTFAPPVRATIDNFAHGPPRHSERRNAAVPRAMKKSSPERPAADGSDEEEGPWNALDGRTPIPAWLLDATGLPRSRQRQRSPSARRADLPRQRTGGPAETPSAQPMLSELPKNVGSSGSSKRGSSSVGPCGTSGTPLPGKQKAVVSKTRCLDDASGAAAREKRGRGGEPGKVTADTKRPKLRKRRAQKRVQMRRRSKTWRAKQQAGVAAAQHDGKAGGVTY